MTQSEVLLLPLLKQPERLENGIPAAGKPVREAASAFAAEKKNAGAVKVQTEEEWWFG